MLCLLVLAVEETDLGTMQEWSCFETEVVDPDVIDYLAVLVIHYLLMEPSGVKRTNQLEQKEIVEVLIDVTWKESRVYF